MEQHENKRSIGDSKKIAEKSFEPSDYQGTSQLEKGLSETHEQVEDDYFEGTVDQLDGSKDPQ